jgi:hypothetical protein
LKYRIDVLCGDISGLLARDEAQKTKKNYYLSHNWYFIIFVIPENLDVEL